MQPPRQRWSEAQAQTLLALRAQGLSQSAIAASMGISKGMVGGMVRRMGLSQPKPLRVCDVPRLAQEGKQKISPEKNIDVDKIQPVVTRIYADERCFWPMGVPGTKGFRFCGRSILKNYAYCADHAHVAYGRVRVRS